MKKRLSHYFLFIIFVFNIKSKIRFIIIYYLLLINFFTYKHTTNGRYCISNQISIALLILVKKCDCQPFENSNLTNERFSLITYQLQVFRERLLQFKKINKD